MPILSLVGDLPAVVSEEECEDEEDTGASKQGGKGGLESKKALLEEEKQAIMQNKGLLEEVWVRSRSLLSPYSLRPSLLSSLFLSLPNALTFIKISP